MAGPMAPVFVEGLSGVGAPRRTEPTPRRLGVPSVAPASEEAMAPPPPAERGNGDGVDHIEEIAKEAARILRVDRVAVWTQSGAEGALRCLLRHHRREGTISRPGVQPDEVARAFGESLREEGTLTSEDSPRNGPEALRGWIAEEGIRAFIAEPLRVQEELVGFVTFEEDRGPRRWTPHARELAVSLAGQIGAAMREPERPVRVERSAGPSRPADLGEPSATEIASGAPAPPQRMRTEAPMPEGVSSSVSTTGLASHATDSLRLHAIEPEGPQLPRNVRAEPEGPEPAWHEVPTHEAEKIVQAPELARAGTTRDPAPAETGEAAPRGNVGPDRRSEPRRLSRLESAALLASESVPELLRILEVQRGSFRLLEDSLAGREGELDILMQAKEAAHRVESALKDFLVHLRRGVGSADRVELNVVLSTMIASLAEEAGDKVRLRVAPGADPIPVNADPSLLEHALLHLVRNSREAAPDGTDVRLSWGRVYASGSGAPAETGLVRIRVEDRGEGMPPEQLPWVLEPYHSLTGEEGERRGLGLAVVRAIIEGHGGWLEIGSRPGEGTVVDLFLPISGAPAAVVTAPVAAPEAPKAVATPVGPATVLILEDEPLLARLIEQILARNGYRTELAGGAAEAERRWHRLEGGLDLVIVERELAGGRSGLDLVRRWRRESPELRAVVLDRRATPDAEGEPQSIEGFPMLQRPFDPSDVLKRVREELAGRADDASTEDTSPEEPTTPPSTLPESPGQTGRMLAH